MKKQDELHIVKIKNPEEKLHDSVAYLLQKLAANKSQDAITADDLINAILGTQPAQVLNDEVTAYKVGDKYFLYNSQTKEITPCEKFLVCEGDILMVKEPKLYYYHKASTSKLYGDDFEIFGKTYIMCYTLPNEGSSKAYLLNYNDKNEDAPGLIVPRYSDERLRSPDKIEDILPKTLVNQIIVMTVKDALTKNPMLFKKLETKFFTKEYEDLLRELIEIIHEALRQREGTDKDTAYAEKVMLMIAEKTAKEKEKIAKQQTKPNNEYDEKLKAGFEQLLSKSEDESE